MTAGSGSYHALPTAMERPRARGTTPNVDARTMQPQPGQKRNHTRLLAQQRRAPSVGSCAQRRDIFLVLGEEGSPISQGPYVRRSPCTAGSVGPPRRFTGRAVPRSVPVCLVTHSAVVCAAPPAPFERVAAGQRAEWPTDHGLV